MHPHSSAPAAVAPQAPSGNRLVPVQHWQDQPDPLFGHIAGPNALGFQSMQGSLDPAVAGQSPIPPVSWANQAPGTQARVLPTPPGPLNPSVEVSRESALRNFHPPMRIDFLDGYGLEDVNWAPEETLNKDSQPPYPSHGQYRR
jgi:hypothetical protein